MPIIVVNHLFPTKPPIYQIGQVLVASVGVDATFHISEFFGNLENRPPADYFADFDWGDGPVELVTGITAVTHKWLVPGRYTLIIQANLAGSIQTGSWDVDVVIARSSLTGDVVQQPWVAALHDTFADASSQTRHVLTVLPKYSGVVAGTLPVAASWGTVGTLTYTASQLAAAVNDTASRWQAAFASGFGWMPMPAKLEQAGWAHFGRDAIAVGSALAIKSGLANVEQAWRESVRDPSDGHHSTLIASNIGLLYTAMASVGPLIPLPWTPSAWGDGLGAGERSVRCADIKRYLDYLNREAYDEDKLTEIKTYRWRRLTGQYVDELPTWDADTAWAWEVSQTAMQVVYSFYLSLATATEGFSGTPGANTVNAQIMVFGNPATGQVALWLRDEVQKLWAIWQVGACRSATGGPEMSDLVAQTGGSHGGFVGVRGVAMQAVTGSLDIVSPFDIRQLQTLLTPSLRAAMPAYKGSAITTMVQQTGVSVTSDLAPDGAVRRSASLTVATGDATNVSAYAVDVTRPALALDTFDKRRGGLRPHAAMAVLARQTQVASQDTDTRSPTCGVCNPTQSGGPTASGGKLVLTTTAAGQVALEAWKRKVGYAGGAANGN